MVTGVLQRVLSFITPILVAIEDLWPVSLPELSVLDLFDALVLDRLNGIRLALKMEATPALTAYEQLRNVLDLVAV